MPVVQIRAFVISFVDGSHIDLTRHRFGDERRSRLSCHCEEGAFPDEAILCFEEIASLSLAMTLILPVTAAEMSAVCDMSLRALFCEAMTSNVFQGAFKQIVDLNVMRPLPQIIQIEFTRASFQYAENIAPLTV
jgi:hypothetical protein